MTLYITTFMLKLLKRFHDAENNKCYYIDINL